MNKKQISLILLIFLNFIGIGLMMSNIQSRQANQLLDAHGLGNNAKYFSTTKNTTVSDFLKDITNRKHGSITIHFDNTKDKNQVLIWSNNKLQSLSTQKGRYFQKEDFEGKVSFVVLGPDYQKDVIERQNNSYLKLNNSYYSVIGELKNDQNNTFKKYYLSTGIEQPTGKAKLNQYKVVIDSSNQALLKYIENKYQTKMKIPEFVKKHQYTNLSILGELTAILIFMIIVVAANILLAWSQIKQIKKSNLTGKLKTNLIINRGIRIILAQLFLAIIAESLLNWKAFYSKPDHLFVSLSVTFVLGILAYLMTWFLSLRREKNRA